ncbi:GNAT family N-acetyltransferase [Sphingomonas cavernae]|uniref:GNAT family N-acetyltransferase n=1 Tax=Sphingomonas cavernae TaxID=2320861 RepID=UPI00160163FF|nr:GNAT family N-acetyltransferase [Sphingomonas cavernae]
MWVKGEYFDDFDAVEAAARGSLDRAAQPILFDRLAWFRRTWEHCPPGVRPLVARAVSEKAQCWLFLARKEDLSLTALASWYTLAFRPVFSGVADDAMKLRLLTAIAKRLRGTLKAHRITLSPVPVEDGSAKLLAVAFARAGWKVAQSPATVNWVARTTGLSFADYWKQRPGELRSTVMRKAAKTDLEIEIFQSFDEAAWQCYETIYEQSWKPEEGAPGFLRTMATDEGTAGTLRLGVAKLAGRPVAAQLWTVENGAAIIHKLAYVEDAAAHSPGTLLSAAMFEHALDRDQVSLIDYGTGDDGYKANWMDDARALEHLEMFNPRTIAGWFGWIRARLRNLVRGRRVD